MAPREGKSTSPALIDPSVLRANTSAERNEKLHSKLRDEQGELIHLY